MTVSVSDFTALKQPGKIAVSDVVTPDAPLEVLLDVSARVAKTGSDKRPRLQMH